MQQIIIVLHHPVSGIVDGKNAVIRLALRNRFYHILKMLCKGNRLIRKKGSSRKIGIRPTNALYEQLFSAERKRRNFCKAELSSSSLRSQILELSPPGQGHKTVEKLPNRRF